jgi:hypothetical protein
MFPEVLSIMATKADAGRSWGGSVIILNPA